MNIPSNILRIILVLFGLISIAFLLQGCGGNDAVTAVPPPTPPPATPKAKFLYTTNNVAASISGFTVDTSTGVLTPLAGFPIHTGVNPVSIVHDPLGKFAIVADIAANTLRVYSINASTGMLTEVPPSPYSVTSEPKMIAFDPGGKFLYVSSQGTNTVEAFSMSSAGVLTRITGSPFPTGGTQSFGCCVLVHPNGKFVYVADLDNIHVFSIDPSSGALTAVSTVPGPVPVDGLAFNPSGVILYAVGSGMNSILSFNLNTTTGELSASASSPLALQDGAFAITIQASGKFAYTVEAGQSVVAYSLKNGVFTSLGQYAGGLGSLQLAIDPTSSFLYAPQTGTLNNVQGFRIGADGTLTALPGVPASAEQWPMSLTIISQ